MMYFLLAICLVFSLLLVFNLAGSAMVSLAWRLIAHRAHRLSARSREQLTFTLRAMPIVFAALIVFVFMLPAYLLFEPRNTREVVGVELALAASLSIIGIGFAVFRMIRSWYATRQLTSNWLANAESITLAGVAIPTFRISHPFPVIAVVGIFRPRLFIASQIFDLLSEAEFDAAIAHECGHLSSYDNFKRAFLRFCGDSLILPIGRRLERAWSDSTESAADDHAAISGGKRAALDLASTLIKIARVAPPTATAAMPAGSLLVDVNDREVSHRVRRLMDVGERMGSRAGAKKAIWLVPGVVFSAALVSASNIDLLKSVHNVTENIVHLLQ